MPEPADKTAGAEEKAWPFLMTWVGRTSALIGLFASLAGGVTWFVTHHQKSEQRKAKMALAATQLQQADYQGAVASYGEILKDNPGDQPALDAQLKAAELWTEDFHAIGREGQDPAASAAASLDQIMPILDAGLARSKGTQAAGIQAHVGWAHWLNQKIAQREFGDAAEKNFRAALQLDPGNVYANAMLGNWLLQTNGNLSDALQAFALADAAGTERPLVRRMELGALQFLDQKGARAAQVKIADAMRKNGETLSEDARRDILSFCFSPSLTEHSELVESLSAVDPDDEWKTYLWLDDSTTDPQDQRLVRAFIQASLLEVSGKPAEALAAFRQLDQELKGSSSNLPDEVHQEIARLSHG